ncbi:MAG: response regulator [Nitrospiraceae bacterium]
MRHLILVIDNECEIPGVLREGLTPIGFDVVWVNVLAILENEWLKKTKFEGIILNFDMRDYPGMVVLERLHEQGIEIPVIVMSSVPNCEQLEEAVRKGARDYIVKPFNSSLLQEKCLRHFSPRPS